VSQAATASGQAGRAARWVVEYGLLVALLGLMALFAALNPRFLTGDNLATLLEQNAPVLIISVGMTFAIISRTIDLSPASILALAGVVLGLVFQATGSLLAGIAAGFACALIVELFNALLIIRFGLSSLIVTLASWIWARGLGISLTTAESIPVRAAALDFLTRPLLGPVSPAILLALLTFIVGAFLLNQTRLGRYTFAMGSNERAAIQAGIPVGRYRLLMFAMFGVCVWLAMLVTVSRLGAAAPNAAYGLELDAIVAVIIGGNAFQGGEGRMRRTLIGALFIAVLNNGLGNLGMFDAQIAVYKGLAIVLALLFGVLSARALRRR
jgi:ribose/xylose/arabinose/galactoside ABC-type transport system permease subunit